MQKVAWFFLISFFISLNAYSQSSGRIINVNGSLEKADDRLVDLIRTHPDQELRADLKKWLVSAKIYKSFQSDIMPDEMSADIVPVNGRDSLVLVVNPDFILKSTSFNFQEDQRYKQLVIYHEYIHMVNQFNGKYPILPAINPESAIASHAASLWHSEKEATWMEWQLAKKIGAKYMLKRINDYVSKVPASREKAAFLDAFYSMIMGAVNTSHPELFRPVWKKLYESEKKSI